jgi:hypothetical protein
MSSGFNTDVRVGDRLFHVQTEDRGPSRPVIDTMVYHSGRVLYRRSLNYKHYADSLEFTQEGLRERVEEHHRTVIDDLRAGTLEAYEAPATPAAEIAEPPGIQMQLLNPDSWLTASSISLNLEILRREDQKPESGARVEALIEGSLDEKRHAGMTDKQGRVQIHFPMPKLGKGGLALVIQANAQGSKDEIRLVMRSGSR